MSYRFLSTILGIDANFTGRLGVGTTTPGYQLDVFSTNQQVAKFANNGTSQIIVFGSSLQTEYSDAILRVDNGQAELFRAGSSYYSHGGVSSLNIWNSNGPIAFHPNNLSNAMFIANSGNVLIGTTTDSGYKLDVAGTSRSDLHIFRSNQSAPTADAFIFRPTDNTVALGTANTERMRISSAGKVLIGTTTAYSSNAGLLVQNGTTINASSTWNNSTTGSALEIFGDDSVNGGIIWASKLGNQAWGNVIISPYGGNVGIGTSSPSYKLTVQDTVNTGTIAIGNVTYPGLIYSSASSGEFRIDNRSSSSGGYISFFPNGQAGSIGTEAMRIAANGNVGIGAAPSAKLEVYPGTISGASLQEILRLDVPGDTIFSNATGYINFRGYDISNGVQKDIAWVGSEITRNLSTSNAFGGNLIFRTTDLGIGTTPQERMRITYGGSVGIGTTTPIGKLDVYGSNNNSNFIASGINLYHRYIVNNTDVMGYIGDSSSFFGGSAYDFTIVSTNNLLFASGGGNERMRITSSGNVLIGTTTDPGYKLNVDGTGIFTSGVTSTGLIVNGTEFYYAPANYTSGGFSRLLGRNSSTGRIEGMSAADVQAFIGLSGYISGSGTTNYIPKFTGSTAIGNSSIYDNGGNIGIGTTGAAYRLEVNGLTKSNGLYIDDNYVLPSGANGGIEMRSASTSYNAIRWYQGTDWTGVIHSFSRSWVGGMSVGMINIQGFNGVSIGSWANPIAMFLEGSGNVLIGTITDNGYKLQVVGDTYTSGAIRIAGSNPFYFQNFGGGWYMSDSTYIRTYSDKSIWTGGGYLASQGGLSVGYGGANPGSQNAIIAGNLGINTSSPSFKLQIGVSYNSTSGSNKLVTLNTGGYYSTSSGNQYNVMGFTATVFDPSDIYTQTSGESIKNYYLGIISENGYFNVNRFSIIQGGAERLTIQGYGSNAGFVGIGTTNPLAKLHINESSGTPQLRLAYTNSGTQYTDFYTDSAGGLLVNAANNYIIHYIAGNPIVRMNSNGNVLIGTTTDNGYKLQVLGNIKASYNTTYDSENGSITAANGSTPAKAVHIGYDSAIDAGYISSIYSGVTWKPLILQGGGGNVGIGTSSPSEKLQVNGSNVMIKLNAAIDTFAQLGYYENGTLKWNLYNNYANDNFQIGNNGGAYFTLSSTGVFTLSNLAGSGTRMVVADSSGTLSTQAIPGGGSANGSWQENSTQTAPANNTGTGVIFSTLNFRTGVNVIPDSNSNYTLIQMAVDGTFNIQFSLQFQNTNTSDHDVYVWLRKNGENTPDDIPNSNTIISVPSKHGGTPGHTVAAWNLFVEASAGDFFQLVWATDSYTAVTMEYYSSTGFCPATPSSILTVNQVN